MRKETPPGVTFDVPHELRLAQFEKLCEGWLELAARLERGETLSEFERGTIAQGVRLYVKGMKRPARPRGNTPKFDAGEAAMRYGHLVNRGDKPADAIGKIADMFGVSEEAVRRAIAPMREDARYLASIGVMKPNES